MLIVFLKINEIEFIEGLMYLLQMQAVHETTHFKNANEKD